MASGTMKSSAGIRIPLSSATQGISVYGHLVYDRGSNTVRIYLAARKLDGTFDTGADICVIPEGYRPKNTVELPAFVALSDTSYGVYLVEVYPSGAVEQKLTANAKYVVTYGEYSLA